uniref:Variant surface glycoprotein 1125.4127 n=1 Tax=Trypanosoma brucei TaxID=5691 RepID=A0A1J0RAB7_9TRYP|nr:variant surface glycoprotein 1125.4127 [Trypanosoma brucei]
MNKLPIAVAVIIQLMCHRGVQTDDSNGGGALSAQTLGALCTLGGNLKKAHHTMIANLKSENAATEDHLKKLRILTALHYCNQTEIETQSVLQRLMISDYIETTDAKAIAAEAAIKATAKAAYWPGRLDEIVKLAQQMTKTATDAAGSICLANVAPDATTDNGIIHSAALTGGGLEHCNSGPSDEPPSSTFDLQTASLLQTIHSKTKVYAKKPTTAACVLTTVDSGKWYKTGGGPSVLKLAGDAIEMTAQSADNAPNPQSLGTTASDGTHTTTPGSAMHDAVSAIAKAATQTKAPQLKTPNLLAEDAWEEAKKDKLLQEALNPSEDVTAKYTDGLPKSQEVAYKRISKLYKELGTKLEQLTSGGEFEQRLRSLHKAKKSCNLNKGGSIEQESDRQDDKCAKKNKTACENAKCKWEGTNEKGDCKPKEGEEQTNTAGTGAGAGDEGKTTVKCTEYDSKGKCEEVNKRKDKPLCGWRKGKDNEDDKDTEKCRSSSFLARKQLALMAAAFVASLF